MLLWAMAEQATQGLLEAMELTRHLTDLQEQEVDMVAHILRLLLEQQAGAVVVGRMLAEQEQVHRGLMVEQEQWEMEVMTQVEVVVWVV